MQKETNLSEINTLKLKTTG